MKKNFASDNYSGFHPDILSYIEDANVYDYCYGNDKYTKIVEEEFKKLCCCDVDTFLVFNGTGANIYSIEILNRPASAVVCSDICHMVTMETGALTKVTGMQPIVIKSIDGKIDIEQFKIILENYVGDVHSPQPKIVTLAQVTESGSVYTLNELKEISKIAKKYGLYLHIDGARLSNAIVSMNITMEIFVKEVQPDVVVFGGTKNGLMFGEAVLVFNKKLSKDSSFIRKQTLQLMSKSKFLATQFIPYLQKKLWYENAKNANNMALYLKEELKKIDANVVGSKIMKIEIIGSPDANIIFAKLPQHIIQPLREFMHFYIWDKQNNVCRFITNFDTTKNDVDVFINKIKELLK